MKIYVDGQQVEQVSQFRYLDTLVSEDEYYTKEIRCRIEMAKKVFMEKKKLFRGKMNLELKKRIKKKAPRETQTLHAGCSTAEPQMFAPPQTPFPGAQDGQNLISWRWSLPLPTNPVW